MVTDWGGPGTRSTPFVPLDWFELRRRVGSAAMIVARPGRPAVARPRCDPSAMIETLLGLREVVRRRHLDPDDGGTAIHVGIATACRGSDTRGDVLDRDGRHPADGAG